jgi:plastocyanin
MVMRLRRWSVALGGLVAAGLLMFVLVMPESVAAKDVKVTIGDNLFDPATVTVVVGDTVTWAHTGARPHDVTSEDGVLNSPRRMANGQSYTFTANRAGTFAYICTIHPAQMKATVVVQAAAGAGASSGHARTGGGGLADEYAGLRPCYSAPDWRCWLAWPAWRHGGGSRR